jgi:hypothetical protein
MAVYSLTGNDNSPFHAEPAHYALPKLANRTAARAFGCLIFLGVVIFCLLFIKISRSKQFYLNVIRNNFVVEAPNSPSDNSPPGAICTD